jgi:hypothetical protein
LISGNTGRAGGGSDLISPSGDILYVEDHGTIWNLVYRRDDDGPETVHFDWRRFSWLYDTVTGRSFFEDYTFSAEAGFMSDRLKGRRICVHGDEWNQRVIIDDSRGNSGCVSEDEEDG